MSSLVLMGVLRRPSWVPLPFAIVHRACWANHDAGCGSFSTMAAFGPGARTPGTSASCVFDADHRIVVADCALASSSKRRAQIGNMNSGRSTASPACRAWTGAPISALSTAIEAGYRRPVGFARSHGKRRPGGQRVFSPCNSPLALAQSPVPIHIPSANPRTLMD